MVNTDYIADCSNGDCIGLRLTFSFNLTGSRVYCTLDQFLQRPGVLLGIAEADVIQAPVDAVDVTELTVSQHWTGIRIQ